MVFKKGPCGLGYHDDLEPSVGKAEEMQGQQAVKLKLSVLVPGPEGKEEPPRPRLKRGRPRGIRGKPRKRRSAVEMSDAERDEASVGSSTWEGAGVTSSRSQASSVATDVDMHSAATPSDHSSEGSNGSTEDEGWAEVGHSGTEDAIGGSSTL